MYPTLYHAVYDLLGIELDLLRFVNSFGMFVVLGFICAAITLNMELKRKLDEGSFPQSTVTQTKGKGLNYFSILINSLMGFFVGFKFIYVLLGKADLADPPSYLLSTEGSLVGGIIGAGLFAAIIFRDWIKEKSQYPERIEIVRQVSAKEHAGALAMRAAIWGFIGAKLFHLLEDPQDLVAFFTHFSLSKIMSGLTIYGGLICGGIAVAHYFKSRGMRVLSGADAAGPGVMLAYGIGRLGCHFSGDGDWGVANSLPKPSYLPDWLWSYSYPNNVNGVLGKSEKGGYIARRLTEDSAHDIFDGFGTYLDPGVWPTAVYEFLMAFTLFFVLWSLRKRIKIPGVLFALYLILVGLERLFIEQYRVNDDHEFMGFIATQAEFISVAIITSAILLGGFLYVNARKNTMNS